MKHLTAVRTGKVVGGFSVHLVEVAVPPPISAGITAEAFFLLFADLLNAATTVFALRNLAGKNRDCRIDRHDVTVDIVSAAVGFNCI